MKRAPAGFISPNVVLRLPPARAESLRTGLKDEDKLVRAIAARALGIRNDHGSVDALAELAQNDPEYAVRDR